jgi:quinol monooxygenase YgiN
MMKRILITMMLFAPVLAAQNRATGPATTDPAFYAVSYVEVMSASRAAAEAALKQYRDMSRKDPGFVSVEVFEQSGRPAHFVVLEKWADQKAFDAHGMAEHTKQMLSKMDSFRLGSYDQRPYRTLSAGTAPAAANERAIVLVSHVDFAGPQFDAPALLRKLTDDSRKDEGNVRFEVLQGAMRLNHFTIVEVWQSEKAHDAHAASSHKRQFRDTIAPALGSPLDERALKVVN